jgi:hypothetical protein
MYQTTRATTTTATTMATIATVEAARSTRPSSLLFGAENTATLILERALKHRLVG